MINKLLKISVNVPFSHCDLIRKVLAEQGAGIIEGYSACSFSVRGIGRSIPSSNSKPFIGSYEKLEEIEEERIETFCEKKDLKKIILALKKNHPYQTPVISVQKYYIY